VSRKQISQREANRLQKRVTALESANERRIARWTHDYPGGVNIATLDELPDFIDGKLSATAALGAAIVGRWDDSGKRLFIYAVLP
jgi:hypothetical protein